MQKFVLSDQFVKSVYDYARYNSVTVDEAMPFILERSYQDMMESFRRNMTLSDENK